MELGALYATKRVAEYANQSLLFRVELSIILSRYCSGDWGELCKEDREQNDYENDGSFYLFLNGDKASENWVLCNIFRLKGAISSAALGTNPVIASFRPGELSPHDWDSIRFEAAVPYGDASFQPGTYTGTVYYTIGLE